MTAGTAARSGPDLRRLPLPYLVAAAVIPFVVLALLAGVLLTRAPAASPTVVGATAPDFTLADLDGNALRLSDLRGRPVVLNFWASWCGPCVEEFALLRDAAAAHEGSDLAIVGVVFRDRAEAARAFMDRHGGTWPAAMDPGERVAATYGIVGPPETYFIGRDGSIVARQFGQISAASFDEKLAAIIEHEE